MILLYIFLVFTVGYIGSKKGHFVLGVLGIFLPLLWLIWALLPKQERRYGDR